jgi:hypothetical protein
METPFHENVVLSWKSARHTLPLSDAPGHLGSREAFLEHPVVSSHRVDCRSKTESFGMRCTAGIDLLIRRWRSAVHGVVLRGLRATSSSRPPREEAQVLSQCAPGLRQLTRLPPA